MLLLTYDSFRGTFFVKVSPEASRAQFGLRNPTLCVNFSNDEYIELFKRLTTIETKISNYKAVVSYTINEGAFLTDIIRHVIF